MALRCLHYSGVHCSPNAVDTIGPSQVSNVPGRRWVCALHCLHHLVSYSSVHPLLFTVVDHLNIIWVCPLPPQQEEVRAQL